MGEESQPRTRTRRTRSVQGMVKNKNIPIPWDVFKTIMIFSTTL